MAERVRFEECVCIDEHVRQCCSECGAGNFGLVHSMPSGVHVHVGPLVPGST